MVNSTKQFEFAPIEAEKNLTIILMIEFLDSNAVAAEFTSASAIGLKGVMTDSHLNDRMRKCKRLNRTTGRGGQQALPGEWIPAHDSPRSRMRLGDK
jgi:hypothetical protein